MRTAQLLRPLFNSSNRLLVVLDAGASLPQEWPVSPNILYLSLHNSLGARLAASRAVRDGFETGGMVTNYYDAGYLHTLAITNGFTDSGGKICFNHATAYRREEFTMKPLREHLDKYPNACLLNLFSGDYAEWYFSDMKELFGDNTPPAYLSPFMLEENLLSRSVHAGSKTRGVAAWAKQLDNDLNRSFVQSLENSGRDANLFSLFGWEAATLAHAASQLWAQNVRMGVATGEALKNGAYETPRGKLYFNDEWNTSLAPMYEAELAADDKGNNRLIITTPISDVQTEFKKMTQPDLGETTSGWFNGYTCC
jgi:branched-chain amino acid transport system substrate-binding protein